MLGVKAAIVVVALVILVVLPLLIRETYRLNKHDRPNQRAERRTETTER